MLKVIFSLNPLSNHSNPLGIEVGSKGEKSGEPRMLGGYFGRVFVAMKNEWATVRREERGIYTPRQNLTVQIYVGSSDADLGTSDV